MLTNNPLRRFSLRFEARKNVDPKMIARAKKRLTDPRIIFRTGDAADLFFAKAATHAAIKALIQKIGAHYNYSLQATN